MAVSQESVGGYLWAAYFPLWIPDLPTAFCVQSCPSPQLPNEFLGHILRTPNVHSHSRLWALRSPVNLSLLHWIISPARGAYKGGGKLYRVQPAQNTHTVNASAATPPGLLAGFWKVGLPPQHEPHSGGVHHTSHQLSSRPGFLLALGRKHASLQAVRWGTSLLTHTPHLTGLTHYTLD